MIGNWCAFTKVSEKIRLSTRNQEMMDESPKVSVVLPLFWRGTKGTLIFNFLRYRRWKEMCRFYHSKTNSAIKVDKTNPNKRPTKSEKYDSFQSVLYFKFWTYGRPTFLFWYVRLFIIGQIWSTKGENNGMITTVIDFN